MFWITKGHIGFRRQCLKLYFSWVRTVLPEIGSRYLLSISLSSIYSVGDYTSKKKLGGTVLSGSKVSRITYPYTIFLSCINLVGDLDHCLGISIVNFSSSKILRTSKLILYNISFLLFTCVKICFLFFSLAVKNSNNILEWDFILDFRNMCVISESIARYCNKVNRFLNYLNHWRENNWTFFVSLCIKLSYNLPLSLICSCLIM